MGLETAWRPAGRLCERLVRRMVFVTCVKERKAKTRASPIREGKQPRE